MTESEILKQIQSDFRGVQKESKAITLSVNGLSGEISGMKVAVVNIEKTMDKHDKRITETREGQLLATSGLDVVNREMKQVHRTAQKDRDHVDSEFKDLRDDQTGQQDVPAMPVEAKTNGGIVKGLFKRYGHWVFFALFALGVYFGAGGDEEKTLQVLQNLREIGRKVEQIEKNKTEPVRVPVPVTASDLYSEEMTP